jgi:hypothetical protein
VPSRSQRHGRIALQDVWHEWPPGMRDIVRRCCGQTKRGGTLSQKRDAIWRCRTQFAHGVFFALTGYPVVCMTRSDMQGDCAASGLESRPTFLIGFVTACHFRAAYSRLKICVSGRDWLQNCSDAMGIDFRASRAL